MDDRTFDAKAFDRFLSESSAKPAWALMSPKIWNCQIGIKPIPMLLRKLFGYLGNYTGNRYLLWLSKPLYWIPGMRDVFGLTDSDAEIVEWREGNS